MAALSKSERWFNCLRLYMATSPERDSVTRNSKGCFNATAQVSNMMTCVMNAVRESMKMRMNMGRMQ